ncbi:hypothetical protein EU537_03580 [Candidatus Thorarchaeota archaeon]|nr:MAG: hypothetical protein EU537_03580 [Candidatus Thorarchaeota archaeon]
MSKIDDLFPNIGVIPSAIIVAVVGATLQLSGQWILMLLAGFIGALFTRRYLHSFAAGFVGIALAWSSIFIFLIVTAQALEIADFFIGLLGLSGLGFVVILISILIGALLGGFGGIVGRAVLELVDEIITGKNNGTEVEVVQEQEKHSNLKSLRSTL